MMLNSRRTAILIICSLFLADGFSSSSVRKTLQSRGRQRFQRSSRRLRSAPQSKRKLPGIPKIRNLQNTECTIAALAVGSCDLMDYCSTQSIPGTEISCEGNFLTDWNLTVDSQELCIYQGQESVGWLGDLIGTIFEEESSVGEFSIQGFALFDEAEYNPQADVCLYFTQTATFSGTEPVSTHLSYKFSRPIQVSYSESYNITGDEGWLQCTDAAVGDQLCNSCSTCDESVWPLNEIDCSNIPEKGFFTTCGTTEPGSLVAVMENLGVLCTHSALLQGMCNLDDFCAHELASFESVGMNVRNTCAGDIQGEWTMNVTYAEQCYYNNSVSDTSELYDETRFEESRGDFCETGEIVLRFQGGALVQDDYTMTITRPEKSAGTIQSTYDLEECMVGIEWPDFDYGKNGYCIIDCGRTALNGEECTSGCKQCKDEVFDDIFHAYTCFNLHPTLEEPCDWQVAPVTPEILAYLDGNPLSVPQDNLTGGVDQEESEGCTLQAVSAETCSLQEYCTLLYGNREDVEVSCVGDSAGSWNLTLSQPESCSPFELSWSKNKFLLFHESTYNEESDVCLVLNQLFMYEGSDPRNLQVQYQYTRPTELIVMENYELEACAVSSQQHFKFYDLPAGFCTKCDSVAIDGKQCNSCSVCPSSAYSDQADCSNLAPELVSSCDDQSTILLPALEVFGGVCSFSAVTGGRCSLEEFCHRLRSQKSYAFSEYHLFDRYTTVSCSGDPSGSWHIRFEYWDEQCFFAGSTFPERFNATEFDSDRGDFCKIESHMITFDKRQPLTEESTYMVTRPQDSAGAVQIVSRLSTCTDNSSEPWFDSDGMLLCPDGCPIATINGESCTSGCKECDENGRVAFTCSNLNDGLVQSCEVTIPVHQDEMASFITPQTLQYLRVSQRPDVSESCVFAFLDANYCSLENFCDLTRRTGYMAMNELIDDEFKEVSCTGAVHEEWSIRLDFEELCTTGDDESHEEWTYDANQFNATNGDHCTRTSHMFVLGDNPSKPISGEFFLEITRPTESAGIMKVTNELYECNGEEAHTWSRFGGVRYCSSECGTFTIDGRQCTSGCKTCPDREYNAQTCLNVDPIFDESCDPEVPFVNADMLAFFRDAPDATIANSTGLQTLSPTEIPDTLSNVSDTDGGNIFDRPRENTNSSGMPFTETMAVVLQGLVLPLNKSQQLAFEKTAEQYANEKNASINIEVLSQRLLQSSPVRRLTRSLQASGLELTAKVSSWTEEAPGRYTAISIENNKETFLEELASAHPTFNQVTTVTADVIEDTSSSSPPSPAPSPGFISPIRPTLAPTVTADDNPDKSILLYAILVPVSVVLVCALLIFFSRRALLQAQNEREDFMKEDGQLDESDGSRERERYRDEFLNEGICEAPEGFPTMAAVEEHDDSWHSEEHPSRQVIYDEQNEAQKDQEERISHSDESFSSDGEALESFNDERSRAKLAEEPVWSEVTPGHVREGGRSEELENQSIAEASTNQSTIGESFEVLGSSANEPLRGRNLSRGFSMRNWFRAQRGPSSRELKSSGDGDRDSLGTGSKFSGSRRSAPARGSSLRNWLGQYKF